MGKGGKRLEAGRPRGTGKFGESTKPIRVPISDLQRALRCVQNRFFKLPLYHCPVKAGIPENVEAEVEKEVNLNEMLIKNTADTFLVKVNGSSMIDAGIQEGDLLIVDRKAEVVNKKIVIASLNGELTVKRLRREKDAIWLIAENKTFKPIEILEGMNLQILGVVTSVIHLF